MTTHLSWPELAAHFDTQARNETHRLVKGTVSSRLKKQSVHMKLYPVPFGKLFLKDVMKDMDEWVDVSRRVRIPWVIFRG